MGQASGEEGGCLLTVTKAQASQQGKRVKCPLSATQAQPWLILERSDGRGHWGCWLAL